jgi:hypothetical protein
MKKIISLFQRNYDGDRQVRNEIVPGAEWVLAGEGVATRKWDGTCCLIRDGKLYKRYEVKAGSKPPENFEPANEVDPNTGKQQGWLPVGDGPEDRWFREAFDAPLPDGTYELLGPKIQGNPEGLAKHVLTRHGIDVLTDAPRDFDGLKEFLQAGDIEGIVWWRSPADPDCEKVKIKAKDFGIKRGKR